jgi:hypothetical protein
MTSVQLVADTNAISYIHAESALGLAYRDLIDRREVGLTGHTIAELRAGPVIGRWGERRVSEYLRFLDSSIASIVRKEWGTLRRASWHEEAHRAAHRLGGRVGRRLCALARFAPRYARQRSGRYP